MSTLNWEGYRKIAWGGIAILGAAIIFVLVQGRWFGALTLSGFFVLSVLFVVRERELPTLFDAIFVLGAVINAGGWTWDLYNKPGLYDEVAHFFTIFAITLALGYLFYSELMAGFYDHRIMFFFTIAAMGIAIGAVWELVEWVADMFTAKEIVSGYFDTITDIALDTGGALLAALLNLRGLNERQKSQG